MILDPAPLLGPLAVLVVVATAQGAAWLLARGALSLLLRALPRPAA